MTLPKLAAALAGRGLRSGEAGAMAEGLMGLMDRDRDGVVSFPDFLPCFEEFLARSLADVQPALKRRRTDGGGGFP